MKPGDHPEFFRFPAPGGTSRESTIVLDGEGRFWHDGQLVRRAGMAQTFSRWIRRHPDDGRFILSNGYDWTYFEVQDVPYFVLGIQSVGGSPRLELSDGSSEMLRGEGLRLGRGGAVYVRVKRDAVPITVQGEEARMTPSAQTALEPWLDQDHAGRFVLVIGERRWPIQGS